MNWDKKSSMNCMNEENKSCMNNTNWDKKMLYELYELG